MFNSALGLLVAALKDLRGDEIPALVDDLEVCSRESFFFFLGGGVRVVFGAREEKRDKMV